MGAFIKWRVKLRPSGRRYKRTGEACLMRSLLFLNVLERGHRLLACGVETLVSSKKQEPVGSSNTNLLLTA